MEHDILKKQFKLTPYINPKTGEQIQIGSTLYKNLVNKYGEPNKIRSPKTQRLIEVGKNTYNNLIKEGYTDKQLILGELLKNDNINDNKNVQLNKDVWQNILLKSDINQLSKFFSINKMIGEIYNNDEFWKLKLNQDNLYLLTPSIGTSWFDEYKKLYYSKYKADFIVNYINNTKHHIDDYLMISFDTDENLSNLLGNIINDIKKEVNYNEVEAQTITIYFNTYKIEYFLNGLDYNVEISNNMSMHIIRDFLYKLYYYYPDITLELQNNNDLIQIDDNFFNTYIYIK